MKTPEGKQITFTFGSHPNKNPLLRWTAKLTFPSDAKSAEAKLKLYVVDGNLVPIKSGTFSLASQKVLICDGCGEMTYGDFLTGRHDTGIWLNLPNEAPIPGGLTFG